MGKKSMMPKLGLPLGLSLLRRLPIPRKLGSLDWLYRRILQNHGASWVETRAGPIWKLDLRNPTHRWIVYGDYEGPGFVPWAKRWVREDSMVVDSGANIGQVLLYLAPKIRAGKYIAVEPNPVARAWLVECLERYSEWPVTVESFGLGASPGRASLFGAEGESAVGSHGSLKTGAGDIEVITLDEYCGKSRIEKIDLWKLDMEGGEEAALKGARDLLKRKAIRALVVETDETRFGRDSENMKAHGYEARTWDGVLLHRVKKGFYGNVLFVPEDSKNSARSKAGGC